jgi:UDP-N-acetyl-D-mannosaminuronate dehydrogenase
MKVCVLGLGVGYALACCLAEAGYQTVGVDIDPNVVAKPRKDGSVDRLFSNKRVATRVRINLTLRTDYTDSLPSRVRAWQAGRGWLQGKLTE